VLIGYALFRSRMKQVRIQYAAVLEERQRIAREIHDTLAQGFIGISLQLELVSQSLAKAPEIARQHLDHARLLTRTSMADARRSIWNLRSPELAASDLPTLISRRSAEIAAHTGCKVALNLSGSYHELDKYVEEQLLRIVEESVTNAVRHASATRVDIDLTYEQWTLRLAVRDNGCGFDVETISSNGHFGLSGMRERAKNIGSALVVQSARGQGTEISLQLNLDGIDKISAKR
jgi:signal transduction histidine kinase